MHCSIAGVQQDYGATGILYDVGSVYEGLSKLTDMRKAKGKQYSLEMILLMVVMAKLCGEDKPLGIALHDIVVRARFHRPHRRWNIAVTCEKNNRDLNVRLGQFLLQIEAT